MKHIFYVLLAALALFLAACKKDKKPVPVYLDGNWRQIGEIGFGTIWYPDSINKRLQLENQRYTFSTDNIPTSNGAFELLTVKEYWTGKMVPGIQFEREPSTFTTSLQHDTLVIRNNDGMVCGWSRYYRKVR